MKELFYSGGVEFMSALTIFFILTIIWILYHFILSFSTKEDNPSLILKRIKYGKTMGLFTMSVGFLGQLMGLSAMFRVLTIAPADSEAVKNVYGAIEQTMISPIYGIIIFLVSLALCFITTIIIENRRFVN